MNKRKLLQELIESQSADDKRRTAYHEAGHASMLFMFGELSALLHISMRSTLDHKASVVVRRPSNMGFKPQAQRWMMFDLAGYAAVSRLSNPPDATWLEARLDEGEWEYSEDEDIHKAVNTAKVICGDNNRAWKMLRRMASWTDEAVSHPQLWALVEALAAQLLAAKTRISGNRAERIMDDAWRGPSGLPYMEMGQRWKRRFSIKAGQYVTYE
jgi:hypothetical protein